MNDCPILRLRPTCRLKMVMGDTLDERHRFVVEHCTRGLTSNSAQVSRNRFQVVAVLWPRSVRLVMEPRRG